MSQKYVIVHFVDLEKVPTEFIPKDWPLHITFLANFALPDLAAFQKDLKVVTANTKPFHAVVEGEEFFGPKQNVHVSLVKPDEQILELHNRLLALAQKHGAVFDELNFAGKGFRPHATKQHSSEIKEGQEVLVSHLTLVDMFPDNDIDKRKVIASYPFM